MKPPEHWIPIRIYWQQSRVMVDWGYLGQLSFVAPFFEQTVNQALTHPANLLFRHQTPLDMLGERVAVQPGLPPSGFIFHMSRCGSTLMSQMLAALPANLVISEASPVDTILRSHFRDPQITEAQRIQWLRWVISALGQQRSPEQTRFFVKFDCWHSLFLPLIRRAFPAVPWVFVYRQPVEVLVSQRHQRGAQMIPGVLEPALFGLSSLELTQMGSEEFGARVLAGICESGLANCESCDGKLLNYRQLPGALWPKLLESWGIECSPAEWELMSEASRRDAKNPVWLFEDDIAAKNKEATDEVHELAAKWLNELYQKLEIRRNAQGIT